MNLLTKLCRFRQALVVSDKALSFLTAFVVSDKALFFPRSALLENLEFQNWIKHVTACRTCVPATRCNTTKKGLQAHKQGQFTLPSQQTVIRRTFVSS
jgi:hypothetical protein